jgi:hypothetical protein
VCGIVKKAAESLKERRSVLEPLQSYEKKWYLQTFLQKKSKISQNFFKQF